MNDNLWKIFYGNGDYRGYMYANNKCENVKDILRDLRQYKPYAVNVATGEVLGK